MSFMEHLSSCACACERGGGVPARVLGSFFVVNATSTS